MMTEKKTGTRPLPTTIQKLAGGVLPAFAFLAGCQLDVFSPLAVGSLTAEQIADSLAVNVTQLSPVLYALVATGLLRLEGDRFANSAEANYYLSQSSPAYMGNAHTLWSALWREGLKTAVTVQTGQPQGIHDYTASSIEDQEPIIRGLHPGSVAAAYTLLKRFDFSAYNSLLDVAGGSGGIAITLAEKQPQLRATVVDLPATIPITQAFIAESEARDRLFCESANVVAEEIPGQYDVATVKHFIQILNSDEAQATLIHIGQALKPGGDLYIIGQILDNSRLTPQEAVFVNLVFLNIYDGGQSYTEQEYREWLTVAGFEHIERVVLPNGHSLISAKKKD